MAVSWERLSLAFDAGFNESDHPRKAGRFVAKYQMGGSHEHRLHEFSGAKLDQEISKLQALSSQVNTKFINSGRGQERPTEILEKAKSGNDPLAEEYVHYWHELAPLYAHQERRRIHGEKFVRREGANSLRDRQQLGPKAIDTLTSKGEKIKSALQKEYGEKRGESILYAGKNKGTFTGIDEDMSASPMQPSMTSSQPAMDCWAHMRKWHGKPATDEHLGFAKLENKLSHKSGISNPAAVAASIGRKKYGEAEMAKKSAAGRDALPTARPAMAPKPMMAKPMMPKPAMAKPAMAHGPAMARGPVQSIQRSPTGTKITFHNPMPKPGL